MKLLVRNLSRSTTEQELRVLFSAHGSVAECTLVLDQVTGQSKGFAFVEMPNENEANAAISSLNLSDV
ncbi:RNA recognition motif domain-containing protein, partial [Vibrio anguillarum]